MLSKWGFSLAFDNKFTANIYIYIYIYIYIGNAGEKGRLFFPCGGAPLPNDPVSQYRCLNLPKTDDNDRTLEMMQMPYLDI